MYSQQLSQWCASCHDRYHAQKVDSTAPGTTDTGDLIFAYRHKTGDDTPVWDPVDARYESTSCGYGCHNSRNLNCVACHVAHGTSAQMTPVVQALPWPGEGGGAYDQNGNGTHLGEGWLAQDTRTESTGGTDFDGESRSNLLRIDNRGICQDPACHPMGKESYLDPYDDEEDICAQCHQYEDAHDGIGDIDCDTCHGTAGLHGAACDSCHGAPPDTGAHTTHFGGGADLAAYGGTANISDQTTYNFQCGTCHPISSAEHRNGTVDIELYNASAPVDTLKSFNPPTANYISGGTIFNDGDGLEYTLGTCSDVYCHSKTEWSAPGPVGYPLTDPTSGYIMLDTNGNLMYPPYTVTEFKVYSSIGWGDASLDCNGCHRNNPQTSSPWWGGDVERGVGNSHGWIDDWGYEDLHAWAHGYDPLMCRTCHFNTVTGLMTWVRDGYDRTTFNSVPIANKSYHVNGIKDVVFDPVNPIVFKSEFDLSSTTYDLETRVCSNVPCHFNQPNPEWGKPYDFWNTIECDQCHRYAGSWPPVSGGPWPARELQVDIVQSKHPAISEQDCIDCHAVTHYGIR